jgi:hypothetical protein
MADETESKTTEITQPILINLGAQKPGKIKNLKKGKGKLWEEVWNVVDETREMLGVNGEGKTFIPVVLIYSKKTKKKRLEKLFFPYLK